MHSRIFLTLVFLLCVQGGLWAQDASPPPLFSISSQKANVTFSPLNSDPSEYTYHEFSALSIGRGISPNDVTQSKIACLSFKEERLDKGAPSTSVKTYFVTNSEQLNFALGIDSKANASAGLGKAKLRYKFNLSAKFNQRSMVFVFKASTNYGRWGIKNVKLTKTAEELKSYGKRFEDVCGSRYVNYEWRGASVSAIVTLLSVSEEFRTSFLSEMSASGGWGEVSGGAASKLNIELGRKGTQDRITVEVGATGGDGMGALGKVIEGMLSSSAKTSIEKIGAALEEYISKFKAENAIATLYQVRPMTDWGWDPSSITSPWSDLKERQLRNIAEEYVLAVSDLELSQAIAKGNHPLSTLWDKTRIERLRRDIPDAEAYLRELDDAHELCKRNIETLECIVPAKYGRLVDDWDIRPPKVQFDSYQLTQEEIRVVLDAAPPERDRIANEFAPEVKKFAALYGLNAPHPLSATFWFQEADGQTYQVSTEEPEDGKTGYLWWGDINHPKTEEWLRGWALKWGGAHSGVFYWVIKDRLGRTFWLPLVEASWSGGNHTWKMVF
ncbi:hypothetical protein [Sinorhizobium meliloti]|uniref:hypothetical protein n=1 Tax=Rhizobium meliloti TaxID=382 RepID=UPI000FDC9031|nr:hypothetical protein [Sinorhizobium meliloti]RVH04381.1 hypothetical protein CN210_17420 [Sinorhizobium meliloti]